MKRQLEGEKQRRHLLFHIEDHPGESNYEIARGMQWTRGKVAHHLKELVRQGEIRTEKVEANPRRKKVYYSVKWDEMMNWDEIPKDKRPDC